MITEHGTPTSTSALANFILRKDSKTADCVVVLDHPRTYSEANKRAMQLHSFILFIGLFDAVSFLYRDPNVVVVGFYERRYGFIQQNQNQHFLPDFDKPQRFVDVIKEKFKKATHVVFYGRETCGSFEKTFLQQSKLICYNPDEHADERDCVGVKGLLAMSRSVFFGRKK